MDPTLQEIVKHIGRPIDTACNLIENVLGEPTRKIGDLLGDQISYWQWSNRLSIAQKAAEKLADKGIQIRQLPLDFSVPFLRECGDAEDQSLQEWWAEMLASATHDSSLCHVAFVNTLRSMSPADVRFLDTLLRIAHVEKDGRIEAIAQASGLSDSQVAVSFHNLEALGFFTPTASRLKGFAFDFLNACYPQRNLIDRYKDKQSTLPRKFITD
jgi:predicted transcriptional regulator